MRATITKGFEFEASHQLAYHDGKCQRLHGHSYKVDVEASGTVLDRPGDPGHGMVVDFYKLSRVWKTILEPNLDHRDLNLSLAGECPYTTAEHLAAYLLRVFHGEVPQVTAVTVSETRTGRARVTLDDLVPA